MGGLVATNQEAKVVRFFGELSRSAIITNEVMAKICKETAHIPNALERSVERQMRITEKILDGFKISGGKREAVKALWRHNANASEFQSRLAKKEATLKDAVDHYAEHADAMETAIPHITLRYQPQLREYIGYLRKILEASRHEFSQTGNIEQAKTPKHPAFSVKMFNGSRTQTGEAISEVLTDRLVEKFLQEHEYAVQYMATRTRGLN